MAGDSGSYEDPSYIQALLARADEAGKELWATFEREEAAVNEAVIFGHMAANDAHDYLTQRRRDVVDTMVRLADARDFLQRRLDGSSST